MRMVLQRVTEAQVNMEGEAVASIKQGIVAFMGISDTDTIEIARKMLTKVSKLRIFADEAGKTNLSIEAVGGALLLVSQFTLYADCKKGNRPSFTKAGEAEMSETLFNESIIIAKELFQMVSVGVFGGDMKINLANDGPFTLVLDSDLM